MAQTDGAVVFPGTGKIYFAPVGSTLADVTAPGVAFVEIGHTSLDDMPAFSYDGGDSEVKGSWQKKSLRNIQTEAPVEFVTFTAHQFDRLALSLYYGTDGGAVDGRFGVVTAGQKEGALLITMTDGTHTVGFFASKGTYGREDNIELDSEEFNGLPIRFTILSPASGPAFEWIDETYLAESGV